MADLAQSSRVDRYDPGDLIGTSHWITITQAMISDFGKLTLDPDPLHVDEAYAANGPFGGTIAFGFLTMSLLTHMLHDALGGADYQSRTQSHYLNYGFDRLRFVAPVKVGARVRGVFKLAGRKEDEKGRTQVTFNCSVEIEGDCRPALVGEWISLWVPENAG